MAEKIAFKVIQRRLRININTDGTVNKRFMKKLESREGGAKGFHGGGFFLGLLPGPFGLVLAYIGNDDKRKNRIKWAWVGLGVWVVFAILYYI